MSKVKIQRLLTGRLGLESPRFLLENDGDMIIGSVISRSFEGSDDFERQQSIRNTLREELDPDSVQQVGMIFAYTPEEWDFDAAERVSNGKSSRRGSNAARGKASTR